MVISNFAKRPFLLSNVIINYTFKKGRLHKDLGFGAEPETL